MNVVISGSAKGIGRAIALKFIKEGHKVYGFDISESSIDDPYYEHYLCDVREEKFPEVPEPDIVINNAGTFEERDAIDVNLKGTINFNEHFVKSKDLKSVLFIASASARNGAEFPQYAASKAGMVGYMKNKALELSHKCVTVNSISPGGVITDSNAHILESEELYEAVKAETLLGKWADPEEIADLAYFLTVVNRSMTGEDLLIDNGEMIRSNFIW